MGQTKSLPCWNYSPVWWMTSSKALELQCVGIAVLEDTEGAVGPSCRLGEVGMPSWRTDKFKFIHE